MKGPGVLTMAQIAAGISMAGPMFIIGFEYARTGQPAVGAGLFALGVVVLYFPTWLAGRIGGPRTWVRRRLGRESSGATSDDEGEVDGARANGDDPESTSLLTNPLRRFREP